MKKHALLIALGVVITASLTSAAAVQAADAAKAVKVFILAGQSNMEGKAANSLLDYQAEAPKTKDLFKHLRKDGKWIVRDDVFIKYLDRKGPLTIGYGSPGRTGVELEFGTMMGDHFHEPVLLIKAAWGGHSLVKTLPLAVGRLSGRRSASQGTRTGAGPRQEEQREAEEERSAADDGRHQEGLRLVVPQHDGRSEGDVRQLRDDVPGTEGQEARIGRVRLVPGLERHVRRRRKSTRRT